MEIETKLVSVIMPAYNGEKFIEEAIQSMLAQSYLNWELIVVDDGSTDRTASIVKAISDPRIRYAYQENHGQASALNHGLRLAKGDYITTLDTDDWFTVDSLLERVKYLNENPKDGVVYGDGIYCNVEGEPIMQFSDYRVGDVTGDVYDVLITSPFFGTGGNVMVRRDVFENHAICYDEAIVWCQDYDIYIRIAERVTFGVIDTITIWYRLHNENMTLSMPGNLRFESYLQMKYKVLLSPRFKKVSTNSKAMFFYQILIYDLNGQIDKQVEIINNEIFHTLPKNQKARLLRLAAHHYILIGNNLEFAKQLLGKAWLLQPFNPKTFLMLTLAYLHSRLSQYLLERWQQWNKQESEYKSPFQIAREI